MYCKHHVQYTAKKITIIVLFLLSASKFVHMEDPIEFCLFILHANKILFNMMLVKQKNLIDWSLVNISTDSYL